MIPLLCIGFCLTLILNLNTLSHQLFVIWLCIGLVVYFLYGVRHSTNSQNGTILLNEPIPCIINPENPVTNLSGLGSHDPKADIEQ